MPRGSHFTPAHQSAAGHKNIHPRTPGGKQVAAKAKSSETLDAATLRLQQAKADTEELDAEKRREELAVLRRGLIPEAESRDAAEAIHLQWVAEIEQLPHSVATSLPPEVPASQRELLRQTVEAQCNALRLRIGGG